MDRVFGEYIDADDLQNSAHALLDPQGLIENGDHQVNADRDPDLRLYGVLAQPEEGLHAKILLDPLEEKFDLPACFVDFRNDQRIDLEVVGDKDQKLSALRVLKAYPPQVVWKVLLGLRSIEADCLVGSQAGGLVHGTRLPNVVAHVGFRPCHEEGASRMDACQPKEIDVSTIQYIEGSGFENDPVQGVDVVDLPFRDRDERGDRTVQVDHGMKLDRGLAPSKARPRKEVHAQIYSGGVDGVDYLVYLQNVSVGRIQIPSLADEDLSELEVNLPVAMLVGVGKVGPCRRAADTHSVEQVGLGSQAGFDVAQAFPVGELGESHAKELVPCREASACPWRRVARNASLKLFPVDGIANLSENEAANVHVRQSQQGPLIMKSHSNA